MTDLHVRMANAVRALAMEAVEAAKSGHPGLPMGAADIATVLFTRFLKYDVADPRWPDRDRFVLSAGHGSMLLYAVLHLLGSEHVTADELKRFRKLGSLTPGHPENFVTPGVETTTGPLGQGLATAVGMALAEEHLRAIHGPELVDHRTYVLASDGDLMEGVSQEAIAFAGHQKLSRLVVLWDDNGISIDGALSLADSTDQLARFAASGWATARVDGHDHAAIAAAIEGAQRSDRPTLIACRTVIGYGAPKKAGTAKAHGEPLGAEELAGAKAAYGWTAAPFEVPDDVRAAWRAAGGRGAEARLAWTRRHAELGGDERTEFDRRLAGELAAGLAEAVRRVKAEAVAGGQAVATRKSSEIALEAINAALPEMVGGSADLSGSNNTKTSALKPLTPADRAGRYVHWGIREHGMAAAMNGMALHGGVIPYSGTFLVFSDYSRPAIRLAALMGARVIHVLTHDSIGLGEDGPTHQPIEHLAALRAIPNLLVFRPADTFETAEAWECALRHDRGPSVLALTRQALPPVRTGEASVENKVARGAYVLEDCDGPAEIALFATGSEIQLALGAQKLLAEQGRRARVVSVPCFELFAEQDADYRAKVIGAARVRVGVEAAVRQGWDAIIGDGPFVGMTGFGASAPYQDLFRHFGITAEAVADAALAALSRNA
jgi:transketolase